MNSGIFKKITGNTNYPKKKETILHNYDHEFKDFRRSQQYYDNDNFLTLKNDYNLNKIIEFNNFKRLQRDFEFIEFKKEINSYDFKQFRRLQNFEI